MAQCYYGPTLTLTVTVAMGGDFCGTGSYVFTYDSGSGNYVLNGADMTGELCNYYQNVFTVPDDSGMSPGNVYLEDYDLFVASGETEGFITFYQVGSLCTDTTYQTPAGSTLVLSNGGVGPTFAGGGTEGPPITPPLAVAGSNVILHGMGFTGTTTITINGVSVGFAVVNDTTVIVGVPLTATSGPLVVTTGSGSESTDICIIPSASATLGNSPC